MKELIAVIREMNQRDIWDYAAIIAPIILSTVAIIISLWSSVWSPKIKKLDAFLAWDDLIRSHSIIINNSGRKTLVIKSVTLYASKRKMKEEYELGTHENVWASLPKEAYIRQGEAIRLTPGYGSVYDVFAYKGHAFDVTKQMRNLNVFIKVVDLDGKTWRFKTNFTLGKLDDDVDFASRN